MKNLIYYGYTKESYQSCQDQIRENNGHIAVQVVILTFITSMIMVLLSFVSRFYLTRFQQLYIAYAVSSGVLCTVALAKNELFYRYSKVFVYLIMFLLSSFGIAIAVEESPDRTTLYAAIIVLQATLFTDNMVTMGGFYALSLLVYLNITGIDKPAETYIPDAFVAILFTALAVFIHYYAQKNRIKGQLDYLGTQVLIRNYQATQSELEIRSNFDGLTGLYNRGAFVNEVEHVLKKQDGTYKALVIMDIDKFKGINDTYGHQVGDEALITFCDVALATFHVRRNAVSCKREGLGSYIPKENLAGRLGGDEFIFFIASNPMEESFDQGSLMEMLRLLLVKLNRTQVGPIDSLKVSVGVREIKDGEMDFDELYKQADEALYQSKNQGKNQITIYK